MATETFHALKMILKNGGYSTAVGDEGGFAPNLGSNEEAIKFILRAIETAGYRPGEDISIALDSAASSFFQSGKYVSIQAKPRSSQAPISWAYTKSG